MAHEPFLSADDLAEIERQIREWEANPAEFVRWLRRESMFAAAALSRVMRGAKGRRAAQDIIGATDRFYRVLGAMVKAAGPEALEGAQEAALEAGKGPHKERAEKGHQRGAGGASGAGEKGP